MSFLDNPAVDSSSERSEESVLAVRQFFSQKNGFLARDEIPDFGVDLNVELIVDKGASGHRFPVQIKSSRRFRRLPIDGQDFLEHRFLTSRLGYLCRVLPSLGLVVLYDEEGQCAYYDFVEEIYNRLSARKAPGIWQQQESVTIHVPLANTLDKVAATGIHEVIRTRFENHAQLISRHGSEFGIPLIGAAMQSGVEVPQSIVEFLLQFGATLVNKQEFGTLVSMIQRVPHEDLSNSPKLACLAAIAFATVGRLFDADYFIKKSSRRREELSEEEQVLLDLYGAVVSFEFGRINASKYIEELLKLKRVTGITANKLSIAIIVDKMCIVRGLAGEKMYRPLDLVLQLQDTERMIRGTRLESLTRQVLLLKWAANYHELALNIQATSITAFRIQEKTTTAPTLETRVKAARRVWTMIEKAIATMQEVRTELEENSDAGRIVTPHVQVQLACSFFSLVFNSLMLAGGDRPPAPTKEMFSVRVRNGIDAYNTFTDQGTLAEAYSALNVVLELRELYRELFREELPGLDEVELATAMAKLSGELGKPAWSSVVRGWVDVSLPELRGADAKNFGDMTPGEISRFAETLVESWGLPENRLDNVIAEARAIGEFDRALHNAPVELLQDLRHTSRRETMYAERVTYIGVCKVCRYKTARDKDVQQIIAELSNHLACCPKST